MPKHIGYAMEIAPKNRCIEGLYEAKGRLWWGPITWLVDREEWQNGNYLVFPIGWRPCKDPNCRHSEPAPNRDEPGWEEWCEQDDKDQLADRY